MNAKSSKKDLFTSARNSTMVPSQSTATLMDETILKIRVTETPNKGTPNTPAETNESTVDSNTLHTL